MSVLINKLFNTRKIQILTKPPVVHFTAKRKGIKFLPKTVIF